MIGVKQSIKLSPRVRLLLAAIGLLAAGLLAAAWRLTPDPRGYGTHEQLGLAPCGFARWTGGRPCPTCGMTTAWALALRGRAVEAMAANSGGCILLSVVLFGAAWAIGSAATGRWLGGRPTTPVLLAIGSGCLAATLLDWLRRLALG